jgi:hypothetical protein
MTHEQHVDTVPYYKSIYNNSHSGSEFDEVTSVSANAVTPTEAFYNTNGSKDIRPKADMLKQEVRRHHKLAPPAGNTVGPRPTQ